MPLIYRRPKGRSPVVCSIGTTDPTAGAGLFSDALTFARSGVRAVFVVAGVTAQNSRTVTKVVALPASVIRAQLTSIWTQVRPDAVRIGLLPGASAIDAVRRFLESVPRVPTVVDPVLSSTSGKSFAGRPEIAALRRLMRIATIVTPNAGEAATLSGHRVSDVDSACAAALSLAKSGATVLVKGGHLRGDDVIDVVAFGDEVRRMSTARLRRTMRGTGCALAAAIAASLATGSDLTSSIRFGRDYVRRALRSARRLGKGRPQLV